MLKTRVVRNHKSYTYPYSVRYSYGILSQHRTKRTAEIAADKAKKKYNNASDAFQNKLRGKR